MRKLDFNLKNDLSYNAGHFLNLIQFLEWWFETPFVHLT